MAGEQQRCIFRQPIIDIGRMAQRHSRAGQAPHPAPCLIDVALPGEMVVDPGDGDRSAFHGLVAQQGDMCTCQRIADDGYACPQIMIAEHRNSAERRREPRKRIAHPIRYPIGHIRLMSGDEIACDQHQVGPQRVDLIDDIVKPLRLHRCIADMDVGDQHRRHRLRALRPVGQADRRFTHHRHPPRFEETIQHKRQRKADGDQQGDGAAAHFAGLAGVGIAGEGRCFPA